MYRKEDIEGAVRLLKSLSKTIDGIIGTRTLVSTLSGLAVMENDIGVVKMFLLEVFYNIINYLCPYYFSKIACLVRQS